MLFPQFACAALCGVLFLFAATVQAQTAKLPNVTILATGGTIARTGASSTTTIGYTAATVGVQSLIAAVPGITKVANVSGEQVFQIASENIGDAQWLQLARRVNVLLAQNSVEDVAYAYANVGDVAVNALVAAGAKGVVHAGVGLGIVARNGGANDDELDFVVADTLSPQKARILLMLALTRTTSTQEIQRMFYTY
jgi:L-asparaginase/Glu-tRNA(Gln) amidotransferase subunit D